MNLCAEGGSTGKTRSQTCARLPATINLLPLWNWYKYLHNSPIVRFFCLEAAVMYSCNVYKIHSCTTALACCRFVNPAPD